MIAKNYCAFSQNHKCIKYIDYELSRQALTDAEELCHENWIEIQRKDKYIEILKELLSENHISFPDGPY